MKYNIQQETTQWASPSTPNHIYIFDGDAKGRGARAIGYVQAGTTLVQRFKTPMLMDTRGRKFVPLK